VIDAGDNANCPHEDHNGTLRSVDGDDDGEVVCDIYVFEFDF